MATNTTNYGLTKPDATDFYDINVHNNNMDIIDDALKELSDGKVSSGLIDGTISGVTSADDLDTRLDAVISEMSNNTIKYIVVTFNSAHPVLTSGNYVFRIAKITDAYCTIHALCYTTDTNGSALEFVRSKISGVWTSWARNYNTYFKPTASDVGAAPDGYGLGKASGKLCEDLNTATLGGFYYYGETSLNVPSTSYGVLLVLPRGLDVGIREYTTQIVIDHQLKMFARNYRSDGWTTWNQIGTTAVVAATVE